MNDSTINWDYIVSRIEENLCILVLGPEVFVDSNGESFQKKLIEHLKIAQDSDTKKYISNHSRIKKYYEKEDFFLFEKPADRTMVCYEIKSFYQQIESKNTSDILDKIAQIPFHTILTVTPDLLLKQTFEKNNIKHQFGFHKRKSEPQDFENPDGNNPLIYNMFGTINDNESLVLTNEDMFSYFESIMSRNTLPEKLKSALVKAENLIFLGMPFDRWYMQLLLRLLDVHREFDDLIRFAANQSLEEEVKTFYVEQFKMDFVNSGFSEFINQIHERCSKQGILRKASAPSSGEKVVESQVVQAIQPEEEDNTFEQILELIADGNLDKLFETLTEYFANKAEEFRMELSVMKGKYNRFMRWRRTGVLGFDEFEKEITKLTDGILELVRNTRKT